jgi:transposase
MLQPVRRRTWALAGHTPIQKAWDRHDRISAIGALSLTPALCRLAFYFQLLPHNAKAEDLIWFLTEMHRHLGRKAILVWDRWNVHRSVTTYFQQHHPDWFQFEELPAYSPELNPVEQCWNHTKYADLANFIPNDLDDLQRAANGSMEFLRHNQMILRSTLEYCQLPI